MFCYVCFQLRIEKGNHFRTQTLITIKLFNTKKKHADNFLVFF